MQSTVNGESCLSLNQTKMSLQHVDTEIIIVGAGPAVLTLAQGLRKRGVPFHVIERGPRGKHQGYRFRAMDYAVDSLRNTLPDDVFELMEATRPPHLHGNDHYLDAEKGGEERSSTALRTELDTPRRVFIPPTPPPTSRVPITMGSMPHTISEALVTAAARGLAPGTVFRLHSFTPSPVNTCLRAIS